MPCFFMMFTYARSIISAVKSQSFTDPISGMMKLLISKLTLSIVLNCQPGVLELTQKSRKSSTVSDSFLDFYRVFVSRFAKASRSLSSTSRLVFPLMVLLLPPAGYWALYRFSDATYHTVPSPFIRFFAISCSFTG